MEKDNTFVIRELDQFSSITDSIKAQKLSLHNKVLEQDIVEANYFISNQLEVPLASKLFYLNKVRIVEGKPRSIEKSYVDYNLAQGLEKLDFNDVSFYSVLKEKMGYDIIRRQEEILIVEANEKECELLNLEPGAEVVLIRGTTFKDEEKPFEYYELTCDPSFYRFRSLSNI